MENQFSETKNNITLFIDGEVRTIGKSHKSFNYISELLHENAIDWERIKDLLNVKQSLLNYIGDRLKIIDNVFVYQNRNGTKITLSEKNPVIRRILEGFAEGRDYMSYVRFLDNILKNPRRTSRDKEILDQNLGTNEDFDSQEDALDDENLGDKDIGLFKFLQDNELQITEDGCFLAFKKVREDFMDIYSGKFDNHVGKVVSMKREDVVLSRTATCAKGLHFCSRSYLQHYSSCNQATDVVVIVKVNPKDVISIPVDYDNAKGRCCRYEVVDILKKEEQTLAEFNKKKKSRKLKDLDKKENGTVKSFNKKAKFKLENLPIFATVEEMRKNFKPRVKNGKCYVYNEKKNEYRLYQFIDGTANANLKCIRSFSPED